MIIEFLDKEEPGFGVWSATRMLLESPLTYVLVVNPAFYNIFSASATVLFLTSGTTIELSEEVEELESSVEGIPK